MSLRIWENDTQHFRRPALSNAISGGHLEVVKVLLQPDGIRWKITEVVDQAVAGGQSAIVALIHERSPALAQGFSFEAKDLFTHMVRFGESRSVRYLYDHGLWGVHEVLAIAVVTASAKGLIVLARYLSEKETFSAGEINAAFVEVARHRRIAIANFLYDKQTVSSDVIHELFEHAIKAAHFPIVKLLIDSPHESQNIKDTALETVARGGKVRAKKFIATHSCWTRGTLLQALQGTDDVQIQVALSIKLANAPI